MNDRIISASSKTTAIRGSWVLTTDNGAFSLLKDHNIFVRGGVIEAITQDKITASDFDEVIEYEQALIMPGFVNVHSHCMNGAMLRGIPDDAPFEDPWMTRLIHNLAALVQSTANDLDDDDLRALTTVGMLDLLKSGTTTLLDQFRITGEQFFDVARQVGVRLYGAPTLTSATRVDLNDAGKLDIAFGNDWESRLHEIIRLHAKHDGSNDGKIKVLIGPHAADTCQPDLLRAARAAANEHGMRLTIHLAQAEEEVEFIGRNYQQSPVEYLESNGFLGPDVIAAHCVHVTDNDLAILARSGITAANCIVSFVRGGINVPLSRYTAAGVRTAVGTDSHGMDYISELRTAGFFSKLHHQSAHVATAYDLIHAGTLAGADALGRPDLGRLTPGAKADILVVDMLKPHLQPVWDPIKSLVWKGGGHDIAAVMVNGDVLVRDGECLTVDANAAIRRAQSAAEKVWRMADHFGFKKP